MAHTDAYAIAYANTIAEAVAYAHATAVPPAFAAMGRGREHDGQEAAGRPSQRRRHGGEPQPGGEAEEGAAALARHRGDVVLLVVEGERQHSHHGPAPGKQATE